MAGRASPFSTPPPLGGSKRVVGPQLCPKNKKTQSQQQKLKAPYHIYRQKIKKNLKERP